MKEKNERKIALIPKKVLLGVLFLISLTVFLFSSYQIASYYLDSSKAQDTNRDLVEQAVLPATEDFATEIPETQVAPNAPDTKPGVSHFPDIRIDFSSLKDEYPDMVGWLYQQGGTIHYPVMQGKDNDYYLNRLPSGVSNPAGSLFLDAAAVSDMSGWNQTVYGHNMKNGSMFASLLNYRNGAYFEENPFLFYFTKDRTYRLEIFAGVHTLSDSLLYTTPKTDEEKRAFLNFAFSNSVFSSGVSVGLEDRVVVLSTCSGGVKDPDRFVVLAKLVPLES